MPKPYNPYRLYPPQQFSDDEEVSKWYQSHLRYMEAITTTQFLITIDETITVDGTTTVEQIPNGAVYVDGYVSRGSGSGTITVGDSDDPDGLLENDSTGIVRFDGAYITSKYEVPKDTNVIITPDGFSGDIRIVVNYYIPRPS